MAGKVNAKIIEDGRFIIKMICDEFPQISKIVLSEIVVNRLNYCKLCYLWVKKILTNLNKMKRLPREQHHVNAGYIAQSEVEGLWCGQGFH